MTDERLAEIEKTSIEAGRIVAEQNIKDLIAELRAERAKVAELREALNFYADDSNWQYHFDCISEAVNDEGEIARQSLVVSECVKEIEKLNIYLILDNDYGYNGAFSTKQLAEIAKNELVEEFGDKFYIQKTTLGV